MVLVMVALSAGCATMGLVETIESRLNKIKELLTAKKWDEALTNVAEVIRRDPTQWRAYLYGAQAYVGKAEWGQGERAEALGASVACSSWRRRTRRRAASSSDNKPGGYGRLLDTLLLALAGRATGTVTREG